jgi:hypothetical protein
VKALSLAANAVYDFPVSGYNNKTTKVDFHCNGGYGLDESWQKTDLNGGKQIKWVTYGFKAYQRNRRPLR